MSHYDVNTRDKELQFKQIISGEMQAGFRSKSISYDKHIVKKIKNAGGSHFIKIGSAQYREHTPGEAYTHDPISTVKISVDVNKQGYVGFSIPEEDLIKNDSSFRMEAIQSISEELANQFDRHILSVATLAARPSSKKPAGSTPPKGNVFTLTNDNNSYLDMFQKICLKIDANNIPLNEVTAFVNPDFYYGLLKTKDAFNHLFIESGQVGVDSGRLVRCMGIPIVKTSLLPNSNQTEENRYKGDFSKTMAVVFHRSAVGTVMLQNFRIEKYEDVSKGIFVYRVKMICGHEALKRDYAFEIVKA